MMNRFSQTLIFVAITASATLAAPIEGDRTKSGQLELSYQGPKRAVAVHHYSAPAPRTTHWTPPVVREAPVFHNGSNIIVAQHSGGGICTSFSGVSFSMPTFSMPTFSAPHFSAPTFAMPTFASPTFSSPTFSGVTASASPAFSSPTFSMPSFSSAPGI